MTAQILEAITNPRDDLHRIRGLKWLMLLSQLILRVPPRGGRRGNARPARRLLAWKDGQQDKLIKWWTRDYHERKRFLESNSSPQPQTEARTAAKVQKLLEEGLMSRALRTATSIGNANPDAPGIMDKLRDLHPEREREIAPHDHYNLNDPPPLDVDKATERLRQLPRKSGVGPTGASNEELTALIGQYQCFSSWWLVYASAQIY